MSKAGQKPLVADAEAPPPRARSRVVAGAVGLAAVLVGYLILRVYAFGPSLSDENIYYYMARATATRGLLPYRDYFFAHPPMHLVPLIIMARVFPHSYHAMQTVPAISGAVAAVFLFLLAYRTWGPLAGTLTAGLFAFTIQVLSGTTHDTGVDVAVALIAPALYFSLTGRELWAGVVFALATLAGVYVLPGAIAVAVVIALGGQRRLRQYLVALLGVLVIGNLAAWAIGGREYWHDVYLYPMRIPPGLIGRPFGQMIAVVTLFNYFIAWCALSGLALRGWEAVSRRLRDARAAARETRRRRRAREIAALGRPPWWTALWGGQSDRVLAGAFAYLLATVLFLATRGNLPQYYFMLPFPGLALLGGRGLSHALGIVWDTVSAHPSRDQRPAASPAGALVVAALVLAGVGFRYYLGATSTVRALLSGPEKTYQWSDAPLIGALNSVVRALFWRDTSEPGRVYGAVQEYLWLRSYDFDTARKIANYVRSTTTPKDTIFGDMEIAPLVAMLADRRIAGDVADTSEMRFESGMYTLEDCWRVIDRERPVYVILPQAVSLATQVPGFMERLVTYYGPRPSRSFVDPAYGEIGVFRRLEQPFQAPPLPPSRQPSDR